MCYNVAMSAVEEMLRRGDLFDYYGDLLSEHQKRIYEAYVCEDLSLSEIAEDEGLSRQGVSDLIRRCTRTMEGCEEKLGLIERAGKLRRLCEDIETTSDIGTARELAALMKEEL